MPVRIVHVVSEQTTEDALGQLSLLLAELPKQRFSQRIEVSGRLPPGFSSPSSVNRMRPLGLRLPFGFGSPELARLLKSHQADIAVAWDTEVVPAVGAEGRPHWIMTVSTPQAVPGADGWYQRTVSTGGRAQLVCLSEGIAHVLRAGGLPASSLTVVRPAVDFGAIRRADRARIREELGLPTTARVMLTAGRPSCVGGQYVAVWAAAILRQVWPDVRMILPGGSREDRRATRLAEACYCPEIYRVADDRYSRADLLAASDLLVFAASEDQPAGWVAWAMAAGVPVVAARTPAMAELVSDGQTGFLVDSPQPHAVATRIRLAWEDDPTRRQCVREAGHRAFELFRAEKCLSGFSDLFDRLVERPRPVPEMSDRIACDGALPCGRDVIE